MSVAPVPPNGESSPFGSGLLNDVPLPNPQLKVDPDARASLFDLPPKLPAPSTSAPNSEAAAAPTSRLEVDIAPELPRQEGPPAVKPPLGGRVRRFTANAVGTFALLLTISAVAWVSAPSTASQPFSFAPNFQGLWGASSSLFSRGVSHGFYDNDQGKPLLWVSGEVVNRGDRPLRAKVRAGIYDGTVLLAWAEGTAGGVPTPEELHRLRSTDDARALQKRLREGSGVIPTQGAAPFAVAFYEYPPHLENYRIRVVVSEEQAANAKLREMGPQPGK